MVYRASGRQSLPREGSRSGIRTPPARAPRRLTIGSDRTKSRECNSRRGSGRALSPLVTEWKLRGVGERDGWMGEGAAGGAAQLPAGINLATMLIIKPATIRVKPNETRDAVSRGGGEVEGINRRRKLRLIVALYMLNATRSGAERCAEARVRYRERVRSELWQSRRLRHANRRIAYLRPLAAGQNDHLAN